MLRAGTNKPEEEARALMERDILAPSFSWREMKRLFLFIANEEQAQRILHHFYSLHDADERKIKQWTYTNTLKFSHFIRHGITCFNEAQHCSIMVKPLLLFYGMTSLKKALILLYDPGYPKTSSVLQHGLTTRKKKKLSYRFSEDEIKIQKEGLLPYFSKKVLNQPLTINAKYKMLTLLSQCPEMQNSIEMVYDTRASFPLTPSHQCSKQIYVTQLKTDRLESIKLDPDQLNVLLKPMLVHTEHLDRNLRLYLSIPSSLEASKSRIISDLVGGYHLYLGPDNVIHPLITFHMIMYCLSMLCRYDTEAWGELLDPYTSSERFIIDQFLALVFQKYPCLILTHMLGKHVLS
jgi:hypothetical protein